MAVAYWWGVQVSTVVHWRRALGVTWTNNERTHRLVFGAIPEALKARFGGGFEGAVDGILYRCRARVWIGIVSQMRTVASPEAETRRVPSGLKATAWT
jgi:hypothetical protein